LRDQRFCDLRHLLEGDAETTHLSVGVERHAERGKLSGGPSFPRIWLVDPGKDPDQS
jgi:hypothetical protein